MVTFRLLSESASTSCEILCEAWFKFNKRTIQAKSRKCQRALGTKTTNLSNQLQPREWFFHLEISRELMHTLLTLKLKKTVLKNTSKLFNSTDAYVVIVPSAYTFDSFLIMAIVIFTLKSKNVKRNDFVRKQNVFICTIHFGKTISGFIKSEIVS